jgi:hypothetical protein
VIEPQRMKALEEAWKLIDSATHEEQEALFEGLISQLKEHEARFKTPDNRFDSYNDHAYRAMDMLRIFLRRLNGYNMGWVPEKLLEHCGDKAGRPNRYSRDDREDNCYFIFQMVKRGASETQAMKLLMRLKGDNAMTSGHLREMQNTYRDYKKLGGIYDHDRPLVKGGYLIANFLKYDVSNMESEQAASKVAVAAFRSFWLEVLDLLKSNHDLIATRDSGYPEYYGSVIEWLSENYDDPLDYFYKHPSHASVPIFERKRSLREFINSIYAYTSRQL